MAGYVDGEASVLHSWLDYAGRLLEQRRAAPERMRRLRAAIVMRTSGGRAAPTGPDRTGLREAPRPRAGAAGHGGGYGVDRRFRATRPSSWPASSERRSCTGSGCGSARRSAPRAGSRQRGRSSWSGTGRRLRQRPTRWCGEAAERTTGGARPALAATSSIGRRVLFA